MKIGTSLLGVVVLAVVAFLLLHQPGVQVQKPQSTPASTLATSEQNPAPSHQSAALPAGYQFEPWATTTSGTTYFTAAAPASDAPLVNIYSYSKRTNTYTELPNASKCGPYMAIISPDGFQFLSEYCDGEERPFAHHLYLVDMRTDSVKMLKTLPTGETFSSGFNGFDGSMDEGDLVWKNNSSAEVPVYQEQTPPAINNDNKLLRTETVSF